MRATTEDFLDLFDGILPDNPILFPSGRPTNEHTYPQRHLLYKMISELLAGQYNVLQDIYDGFFLKNDLLLDLWCLELGLPDNIFIDVSTNDKKRAAIIAKRNMRDIYGKNDIIDIMQRIGITIDIVPESSLNTGFPKEFPYSFFPSKPASNFIVYTRILDNPKNFSEEFIISIMQSLITAFEKVIIIE